MAKIKSEWMPWTTGGFNRKTQLQELGQKANCVFKEYGDTIVVGERPTEIRALIGKYQYQKEFFCYADKLYGGMSWGQRKKWLEYYEMLKKSGMYVVGKTEKQRKTHWKKKRWGYHNFALWLKLLWDNALGEFFYEYWQARYLIDEIVIKNGKITAKGWIINKDALQALQERFSTSESRAIR